jgi:hypothetical protein
MTLGVYAKSMGWTEGEPERLRALVEGADWALTDTSVTELRIESVESEAA